MKEWLPHDERYSAYDNTLKRRKKALENECSSLWTRSVMNWDGTIFPCCNVYEKKWRFGNALEKGFAAIWNNDDYRSSRERVADGKITMKKTICHIREQNKAMQ